MPEWPEGPPYEYPYATSISINEEVEWGRPSERQLKSGDLVKIEAALSKRGWPSIVECTYGVGTLSSQRQRILAVSRLALQNAVSAAMPGARLSAISFALQEVISAEGFFPEPVFVGHGIGRRMEEDPQIPCFARSPHEGPLIRPGFVFNIVSLVKETDARVADSGTAVVTADGRSACSNSRMVAIRGTGPVVLTPGPWEREERPPLVSAVRSISEELMRYLARNPRALFELDGHVFERLVGEILASFGFSLEFNVRTICGEIDIIGFTRDVLGNKLGYVVECKRYAERRHVGVSEVTRLFGIREALRTSLGVDHGLLVTTSDFTPNARDMAQAWSMDLRNYESLRNWLTNYGKPQPQVHLPFLAR
jgi:methionyl aminopeptidase